MNASSSPDATRQVVQCVRTWGKACLVGKGSAMTLEVSPDPRRRGGGTQIGSRTFSIVGQAECARFSADRQVDVDWLFSDKRQLTDAKRAYAQFDQQTSSKGVLLF